jgi:hypothetical protein
MCGGKILSWDSGTVSPPGSSWSFTSSAAGRSFRFTMPHGAETGTTSGSCSVRARHSSVLPGGTVERPRPRASSIGLSHARSLSRPGQRSARRLLGNTGSHYEQVLNQGYCRAGGWSKNPSPKRPLP